MLRTVTTNGQVPRQRRRSLDGDVYRGSIDLIVNRPAPDVVVLNVGGEVDMLTAPELRRAAADQTHPPPRVLVIDLRAVTFLGASGLAVLLEIRDAAARTATSVRLVCDTPVVTRPLEILGLRDMFGSSPACMPRWPESDANPDRCEECPVAQTCGHLDTVRQVDPSDDGCHECLQTGDSWVHLRMCQTCGHVGCCDSSPNRHATEHQRAGGHPLVRSFEPGEDWFWCYLDQVAFLVEGAPPAPSQS